MAKNYNNSKKVNLQFVKYLDKEVYGTDLATIINRAVDNNEKNDKKEIKDKSISNGKVKIEMSDNKKVRRRRRKVYISDELRGFLDKGRENLRKTILKKRNEPVKCVISFVLE